MNIRKRIHFSFSVLVLLFVINAVVSIIVVYYYRQFSNRITRVVQPSLNNLNEFKRITLESKMYSTNWVFLRSNTQDKKALQQLHQTYPAVLNRLEQLSQNWLERRWADTLQLVSGNFHELVASQRVITRMLRAFEDYDDLLIRMEAERILEDEVLPRTDILMHSLDNLIAHSNKVLQLESERRDNYAAFLRVFILVWVSVTVVAGLWLSLYLSRQLVSPIHRIHDIVDDLGKGITRTVHEEERNDEIGAMIRSVNQLSVKLERTAVFAREVGRRNFDMEFQPLGSGDVLGHALVMMRDNLRTSQHELEKMRDDLVRRNNDLLQFNYIVSHNLRAPVANIMGLLYLLELAPTDSSLQQNHELFRNLSRSAGKLDQIIRDMNDILKLRTPGHVEKEKVNLKQITEDIKASIEHLVEAEKASLVCELEPGTECIHSIKSYLFSIFYNLILNSIKYRHPDRPPVIRIKGRRVEKTLVIEIVDNGKGIDLETNRENLFGLYKRFDFSVEGRGLGLFMVKTQVETLGGQIQVDSCPGAWSRFTIELPLTA